MQRVLRCNSTRNASFIVKAVRRGHPQHARLERWCTVPTEEALATVSKSALNTGKHMLLAHTVQCRALIRSAPHTVSQCHALLSVECACHRSPSPIESSAFSLRSQRRQAHKDAVKHCLGDALWDRKSDESWFRRDGRSELECKRR
jgi:predicted alpha/beta hydrolase family esterase